MERILEFAPVTKDWYSAKVKKGVGNFPSLESAIREFGDEYPGQQVISIQREVADGQKCGAVTRRNIPVGFLINAN